MAFLGEHQLRLDDKGRLFLPSRWRPDFAEGLVMTKGQEHCLYVFTTAGFEDMSAAVSAAPLTDRSSRGYGRMFFSSAYDQNPDKQGRVTVAPRLREYAEIDRECTVIGVQSRLEIWSVAAWDGFVEANNASYADIDTTGVVASR